MEDEQQVELEEAQHLAMHTWTYALKIKLCNINVLS